MKIKPVAGDEVHVTCQCGYDHYMSTSCNCGGCPKKLPKVCPQCGTKPTN